MIVEKLKQVISKEEPTKYWKKYEKGIEYLNKKGIIRNTDKYWNFYIGNQWEGLSVSDATKNELPVINFVKRIINYKVATVSQNNMVAHYSDSEGRPEKNDFYEKCDKLFSQAWELANEDMELWNVFKEGGITGDGIQYFPSDDFTKVQRIPNTSILYGDESEEDIQKQPNLITFERRTLKSIRSEARLNGLSEEEISLIKSDKDDEAMIGNKTELYEDGKSDLAKATCINYFYKDEEGYIHLVKCTKNVIFAPDRRIEASNEIGETRSLSVYPFLKFSWEHFPNSARGVPDIAQYISNQIEVNKTAARRSMICKTMAFPKIAYDASMITNAEALKEAGGIIEVSSGGLQSVQSAVTYLSPANISNEPANYASSLMQSTLELAGAGETATGNIDPTRVAASAITIIKEQATIQLKEQATRAEKYVEDFARLVLELKSVFSPNGFDIEDEVEDPITGEVRTVVTKITKEELDDMKPRIRIDTSQDNAWSKVAEMSNIKELLESGMISLEEYADLIPNNSDMPKEKLKQLVTNRKKQQAEMMAQQNAQPQDIESQAIAQWSAEDGVQNGLQ